jgi:hypothetical protein
MPTTKGVTMGHSGDGRSQAEMRGRIGDRRNDARSDWLSETRMLGRT